MRIDIERLSAVLPATELAEVLKNEIARLRLTDAEREAVGRAISTLDGWQKTGGYHSAIDDDSATLRGLLERLR